jgi:uncharacterized RDD family membrane protein YckC
MTIHPGTVARPSTLTGMSQDAAGLPPRDADAIVTGEAVAVEIPIARIPTRVLAFAIDLTIQLGLLVGVLVVAGVVSTWVDEALAVAITLVLIVMVIVGAPAAWETLSHGRSLGKLVMGLRVVRDDGGPTRFRHSLVRALFMFFVDFWLTSGSVGLIASLLSTRAKRVGDHFGGTVVVRERVPAAAAPRGWVAAMPPALAPWAASADLARLPDDLALSVRQYLGRCAALDPAVRATLAPQLATQVSAYVGPPAPPGTPAEAYLAAVLAERGRRAWTAHQQSLARTAVAGPAYPGHPPTAATPTPAPYPPAAARDVPPSAGGFVTWPGTAAPPSPAPAWPAVPPPAAAAPVGPPSAPATPPAAPPAAPGGFSPPA